jgi:Kef-type K+ transport system membrane component KefB
VFRALFRPEIHGLPLEASDAPLSRVMSALAQFGLVLLLFLAGMESDFSRLREDSRAALSVSALGVALPFALGAARAG